MGGGYLCNVLKLSVLQGYFFLNIFQYISMDIEIGGVTAYAAPIFQSFFVPL